MSKTKFHISDDGVARKCEATKKPCKFGGDEEHYSTIQEAQKAYEQKQSSHMFNTLQKENDLSTEESDELEEYYDDENYSYANFYEFITKTEDYGITFKAPDFKDVYMETPADGSMFYRFEQLDELFTEYGKDDVEEGYTLDIPLNTLQQYVSKELVEDYVRAESNIGDIGSFSFEDEIKAENGRPPSIMRLLIHKDEFYIIDGNHRFAAARLSEQKTFSGLIILMNDEMSSMTKVPSYYFNKMVERKKKHDLKKAS